MGVELGKVRRASRRRAKKREEGLLRAGEGQKSAAAAEARNNQGSIRRKWRDEIEGESGDREQGGREDDEVVAVRLAGLGRGFSRRGLAMRPVRRQVEVHT